MVLTSDDFAPGALTVYQGSKIAAVFAPVVADMTLSGTYTRTLSDVRLGSVKLAQVYSTAFVAKSESQLANLMRSLTIATVPGAGRRAFVAGVKSGAGADTKASLVRARTLELGDEAVELILHIDTGKTRLRPGRDLGSPGHGRLRGRSRGLPSAHGRSVVHARQARRGPPQARARAGPVITLR